MFTTRKIYRGVDIEVHVAIKSKLY